MLHVSQATQMPWCAGTSKGHSFSYNCSLPTYEMCVQEVIAGNRGFCSPTPYYRGPEFVPMIRPCPGHDSEKSWQGDDNDEEHAISHRLITESGCVGRRQ